MAERDSTSSGLRLEAKDISGQRGDVVDKLYFLHFSNVIKEYLLVAVL